MSEYEIDLETLYKTRNDALHEWTLIFREVHLLEEGCYPDQNHVYRFYMKRYWQESGMRDEDDEW